MNDPGKFVIFVKVQKRLAGIRWSRSMRRIALSAKGHVGQVESFNRCVQCWTGRKKTQHTQEWYSWRSCIAQSASILVIVATMVCQPPERLEYRFVLVGYTLLRCQIIAKYVEGRLTSHVR